MSRVITQFMQKYHARKAWVTTDKARAILDSASAIYAVEEGEITVPSLGNQRRFVRTLRFEQIVPDPTGGPT